MILFEDDLITEMFGPIVKYGLPNAAALSSFVQMDNQLRNSDGSGEDSWILQLESVAPSKEEVDGFQNAVRNLDIDGVNVFIEKHRENPFFVNVLNEALALVCNRLEALQGAEYVEGPLDRAFEIIEQLLRYNARLRQEKWENLLVVAIKYDRQEIVDLYWKIVLPTDEEVGAFRVAAQSLDVDGVNSHLAKHGSNPLHLQVLNEELALVCDRLEDFASPPYVEGQVDRALVIIEQLLRCNARLREEKWENLFVLSARFGKGEIINAYLVNYGIPNPDILNRALTGACEMNHKEIVRNFLANGADPNCEAWEGVPLVCALCLFDQSAIEEHQEQDRHIEVLDMLINAKADVNAICIDVNADCIDDHGKETTLGKALQGGSSKSVEVLLCAGADPNVVFSSTECYDTEETIPLFWATAFSPDENDANLLLFFGAHVDIFCPEYGSTPLSAVARQDDAEEIVSLPILQSTTNLLDSVGLTGQAAQYDIQKVTALLNQGAVPFATSRHTPDVNAVQQAVILGNQDLFDILLFSSLSMAANDYGERVVRKYMHRLFKLDDFACLARTRAVCRQFLSRHIPTETGVPQPAFPNEVSDRILIRTLDPMELRSVQMFKRFVLKMRQMMQEQADQLILRWPDLGHGIPMQWANGIFNSGIDVGSDVCVAFAIIRSLQQ